MFHPVMPGLVPGIHDLTVSRQTKTWIGRETLVPAIRQRRIALPGHDKKWHMHATCMVTQSFHDTFISAELPQIFRKPELLQ
jgi:hypothetical protein